MASNQVEQIRRGDVRAIAKALSRVEDHPGTETNELLKELYGFTGEALIVGVTGSPGAGKSTLVELLAEHYLKQEKMVAVVAVDPSSPFSGGALLGDRVRMQRLATEPRIFIRSMATRGKMGGLSVAVNDALVVLDAAGYEVLIVETVGVGQDEIDIVKTAHVTVVVLVPGMGDDIQTIKAGIMEIGDLFVINKADRDGVLQTRKELEALLSIARRPDGWKPEIIETIASQGKGVEGLATAVHRYLDFLDRSEEARQNQRGFYRERLQDLMRSRLEEWALRQLSETELNRMAEKLMKHASDPYSLVDEVFERLGLEEKGEPDD